MSPLEKVARAIAGEEWHTTTSYYWLDRARDGLTALLDPDEGTVEAVWPVIPHEKGYMDRRRTHIARFKQDFNAAIQHILKGKADEPAPPSTAPETWQDVMRQWCEARAVECGERAENPTVARLQLGWAMSADAFAYVIEKINDMDPANASPGIQQASKGGSELKSDILKGAEG